MRKIFYLLTSAFFAVSYSQCDNYLTRRIQGYSGTISGSTLQGTFNNFNGPMCGNTLFNNPRDHYELDLGTSYANTTPVIDGTLQVSLCDQVTNYDTMLFIGRGCPSSSASFNCFGGNDDSSCQYNNLFSQLTVPVTERVTYILVSGYSSSRGNYKLHWTYIPNLPSLTGTSTRSLTSTPLSTQTSTQTSTETCTMTPTLSSTSSISRTITSTGSSAPTSSSTRTNTRTITGTVKPSKSETASISESSSGSQTSTITSTQSSSSSSSNSASTTQSSSASVTSSSSVTSTPSSSQTTSASSSQTSSGSSSESPSVTLTSTQSSTRTQDSSASETRSIYSSSTSTGSRSHSRTSSRTASITLSSTANVSDTRTSTQSILSSVTSSITRTRSKSRSASITWTPSISITRTTLVSGTETPSASETGTPSASETETPSASETVTVTVTVTSISTSTTTSTATATVSVSETEISVPVQTPSPTLSRTQTPTPSFIWPQIPQNISLSGATDILNILSDVSSDSINSNTTSKNITHIVNIINKITASLIGAINEPIQIITKEFTFAAIPLSSKNTSTAFNVSENVSVAVPSLGSSVAGVSVVSWNDLVLGTEKIDTSILSISAISASGEAQTIKNLSKPIIFKNAIGIQDNTSLIPQCIYWDTFALNWSSAGCKMIGYDNLSIICACDHLTDFAARFAAIADENRAIFANAAAIFSVDGLRRYAPFYIFTGTFFAILIFVFSLLTYINNNDSINYARILAKYPEIAQIKLFCTNEEKFFLDRYYPKIKIHAKKQKINQHIDPYKGYSLTGRFFYIWLRRIYYQHSYFSVATHFDPRVSKQLRGLFMFIVLLNALFITCLLYGYSHANTTEPMSIIESIVLSVITAVINIPVIQGFRYLIHSVGFIEYNWRYPFLNEELKRRHNFEKSISLISTDVLFSEINRLMTEKADPLQVLLKNEATTNTNALKELFDYIKAQIFHKEEEAGATLVEPLVIELDKRNIYESEPLSYWSSFPVHTTVGFVTMVVSIIYLVWCFIYILLFGAKDSDTNQVFYNFISSELTNIIISQPLALFLMPIIGYFTSHVLRRWCCKKEVTKHSYSNFYFFSDPYVKENESTALSVSLGYWLFLRGIAQTNSYYTNKLQMEIAIAPPNAIVQSLDNKEQIIVSESDIRREKYIAALYYLLLI